MAEEKLEFTFAGSVDRNALLQQAAQVFDERRITLSEGGGTVSGPSDEGAAVRDFMEDVAEFAGFPVVHQITDSDFLAQQRKVPVPFVQLAKDFQFYWLYFPTVLFPRHSWAFNRLELKIVMKAPSAGPHEQPQAHQILPAQQFQTLLTADMRLEVRLDENFQFTAKPSLPAGAGVPISGNLLADAKVAAQAGLVAGPFTYRVKKAKIQHTAVGAETVFWRLDGAEFFQDDSPEIIVIVRVPKGLKDMKISAAMQAHRFFPLASAPFQKAITMLPALLKSFFSSGAPVTSQASWDMSAALSASD